MQIDFRIARTRHRITEPVRMDVQMHNDGPTPVNVCTTPLELHFFVDEKEVDWREQEGPHPSVEAAPGATVTLTAEFEPSYHSWFEGLEVINSFAFRVDLTVRIAGESARLHSPPFAIEIDSRDTSMLSTPNGEPSRYVADGGRILYVSANSRAYEERWRVVPCDRSEPRVLSPSYLVDGKAVYRDGRKQRGVSPIGFRVFNPIFAGNSEIILTSYGDAKVQEPAHFEVLDEGDNYHLASERRGYRAGFARDRRFVYFFDESTSTKHAVRLNACKAPATFVALQHGYGRDDQNVYCESNRIKGADPKSWTLLSRSFSRDARRVFWGVEPIAGVDPASFTVLPGPNDQPPFESAWGRDANGYLERRERRSEAEYLAAQLHARRQVERWAARGRASPPRV